MHGFASQAAKQQKIHSKEGTVPLPCVKLFLTGHIEAGKTTLRRNLGKVKCNPSSTLNRRTEKTRERTAGIEIECLEHDLFGTVVAHDLAGHCEYSTSHSIVIDCADSSLFIIMFDITKELKAIQEEVNYWAAFIKAGRMKTSRPRVMLVASHLDEALNKEWSQPEVSRIYNVVLEEWKSRYRHVFHIIEGTFIVNCRDQDSIEMNHLRKMIGRSCTDIKKVSSVLNHGTFNILYLSPLTGIPGIVAFV